MDIQEFVANFAEQFDDTDASEIKEDTHFHDLDEWSSYLALAVLAMVEDEYEVELTASDINGSTTVADLFNIVKSRK